VYNYFLNERVDAYLNRKETFNYYDNAKKLIKLKKDKTWLKEVNSQSLQFTLKCLEGAYGKFFARSAKFPKFKSKKGKQSFCVPQHGKVKNGCLYIVKFRKGIKIKQHRPIEREIKHITVSRNPSGQYFACICVERVIEKLPPKTKAVGVNLGVKTLATQSDGKTYPNIKPYCTLEDRLAKLQQWHSRTEKGSQHRERLRKRIAKLYQRIIDIRSDHLNKVSWEIV
jgi:putative transposase